MADNIFTDKAVKPNDQLLSEALGVTYKYWDEIRTSLRNKYGDLTEEWKYYGAKYGWSLKIILKRRNLFFFTAYDKYFRIGFVFGDKAVSAIEKSDLPKNIIEEIVNARKFAEGRGLRLEIRKHGDIKYIKKLVDIKVDY
jgi:hypothetical protein